MKKNVDFLILLSLVCIIFVGCSEAKVKKDVVLEGENIGGLTSAEVRQLIIDKAAGIDKAPKEPQMDADTWELTPSSHGKKVDVDSTINAVMHAEEKQQIKLAMEEVRPLVELVEMKSNIVEIANYTTPLLDKGQPRVNNIEVAGDEINGEIVLPGKEFSYNEVLGRRTKQKGYEKAPIFVKDQNGTKKKLGVGGGICQLSSTLYNAVRKAGLKTTERHEHSKDVGYVPKGSDATVVYDSADFKFINTREHPIMIKIYRSKTKLTVKLIENRNIGA